MKGRHTITQDDLDEWLRKPQWVSFARSFSSASRKTLDVDGAAAGGPIFRVTDHGTTTFIGADKVLAIAAYNEAR